MSNFGFGHDPARLDVAWHLENLTVTAGRTMAMAKLLYKDGWSEKLEYRGSSQHLKTIFRARKYTRRILNSLGKNGEAFLIDDSIFQTAEIGRIHAKAV